MSAYLILRNWVDRFLGKGIRSRAILLPAMLPFLVLVAFDEFGKGAVLTASLVSASWVGFVFWRGWRMLRATSKTADRIYDRSGKFELSADYHGSESATTASLRKKNG